MGAPLGQAQIAAFAGSFHQESAQRHGIAHMARKRLGAMGADETVRVVFWRQEQELDGARIAGVGQGAVQRLARGAPPRRVAVEAEDDLVGEAEQLVHVLAGAGRAQRGHGVAKAELCQGHHVHVAFGHQGVAGLADGGARLEQAVQFAALVEHRRFGGVEVLGFFVAQHAPAKADALALDVADGKHDAITEAVVALAILLADDHQARFVQQRAVVFGKDAGQVAPALWRVAQAIAFGDLPGDAPALQVRHRTGRRLELLAPGFAGFFQHIGQCGLLLARGGSALALLGRGVVLRHGQADALRQILHRFDETHARVVHQKTDGVAVLAAAEAVVELLGGANAERRRLLPVKGAQPHEVGPAFLELHVASHDIDHVDAGQQLLDERLGNRHSRDCLRKPIRVYPYCFQPAVSQRCCNRRILFSINQGNLP